MTLGIVVPGCIVLVPVQKDKKTKRKGVFDGQPSEVGRVAGVGLPDKGSKTKLESARP